MAHRPISRNNIRRIRRNHELAFSELAELCDLSPSFLARVEQGRRAPSLSGAFALELALGTPAASLFADLYENAALLLAENAARFSIELEAHTDPASVQKRVLLSAIAERTARATPEI